jgi:hypothetical protein
MLIHWRAANDEGPDVRSYVVILTPRGGIKVISGKDLCEHSIQILRDSYNGTYLSEEEKQEALKRTYHAAPCTCNVLSVDNSNISLIESYKDYGLSAADVLYNIKNQMRMRTK